MRHKTTLHILLVLTFISAGFNLFAYAMTALLKPEMQQMMADMPQLVPEQMQTYMDSFLSQPRMLFLAMALLYALEFAGGVLMWNIRASGFHAYTLARLLLLLVPMLFLGKAFVQLGDVMFAVLFILVYWMLMKNLGAFGGGGDQTDLPTTGDTPTDITPTEEQDD